MITTKDVLVKAKSVILEKGWCQKTLQHFNGSCCMLGAVGIAASSLGYASKEYAAREALYSVLPRSDGIVDFNDEEGRTVDEVLAKFDEAIAAADGGAA